MDVARSRKISRAATAILKDVRDYIVGRMNGVESIETDPKKLNQALVDEHVAASIAIEALREVLVMQYGNEWRETIFRAAEALVPPKELRPKNKA